MIETIEANPGELIHTFLERVLERSNAEQRVFNAVHNDRHVIVAPGDNVDSLHHIMLDVWAEGGSVF